MGSSQRQSATAILTEATSTTKRVSTPDGLFLWVVENHNVAYSLSQGLLNIISTNVFERGPSPRLRDFRRKDTWYFCVYEFFYIGFVFFTSCLFLNGLWTFYQMSTLGCSDLANATASPNQSKTAKTFSLSIWYTVRSLHFCKISLFCTGWGDKVVNQPTENDTYKILAPLTKMLFHF